MHSLSQLLAHYKVKLTFVSPSELKMPEKITKILDGKPNIQYSATSDLHSVLPQAGLLSLFG